MKGPHGGMGEVRTDGVIGDRTRSLPVMNPSQVAAPPEQKKKFQEPLTASTGVSFIG